MMHFEINPELKQLQTQDTVTQNPKVTESKESMLEVSAQQLKETKELLDLASKLRSSGSITKGKVEFDETGIKVQTSSPETICNVEFKEYGKSEEFKVMLVPTQELKKDRVPDAKEMIKSGKKKKDVAYQIDISVSHMNKELKKLKKLLK